MGYIPWVAKSRTQLSDFTFTFFMPGHILSACLGSRIKKKGGRTRPSCIAHGTLLTVVCQPGREGRSGENRYVYG